MARKTSKKVYIAVIFGIVFGIGLLSLGADEKYIGELIPFTLIKNVSVDCKAWNQMSEVGVNGQKRVYNPLTRTFDVFTNFNIVSASSTVGEIRIIDTSMRTECTRLGNFVGTFEMVGGKTTTSFYATQENGQEIFIKSITRSITTIPRNVIDTPLLIPTGTVTATEIDNKLTSTSESYTTRIRVVITADMNFKASATGSLTNTGKVSLQQTLTVKVFNKIIDPPQPVSNVVDLTSVTGGVPASGTIDVSKQFSTIVIKMKGKLPQWKESEGTPYVDIWTPDRKLFASNIHMTIKKLVSSSTNTYEFTTNRAIGTNPELGYWQVSMHSNNDVRKTTTGNPTASG